MAVANVTTAGGLVPRKASELKGKKGLCLALFGHGGVGKTTLSITAKDDPTGKDVLLIDVDLGVESITDEDEVMVLQPQSWKDRKQDQDPPLYTILQRLKAQGPDVARYKTVVFDSLTGIYDLILEDIVKVSPTPDMPSQPEYGKANQAMIQMLQDMRKLSYKGIHVVFICHAKEVEQESGPVLTRLALTPGVTSAITRIVDHIGFLIADPMSGNRKLIFKPSPTRTAKFRQPRTGPQLPLEIVNPSMAKIIEHARKRNDTEG